MMMCGGNKEWMDRWDNLLRSVLQGNDSQTLQFLTHKTCVPEYFWLLNINARLNK